MPATHFLGTTSITLLLAPTFILTSTVSVAPPPTHFLLQFAIAISASISNLPATPILGMATHIPILPRLPHSLRPMPKAVIPL